MTQSRFISSSAFRQPSRRAECGHPANLGRHGLSLPEAILAIAIVGAALAVIGELVRIGNVNAMAARDLTDGQRICANLMNEIAAGVTPPTAVSQATCPEDETWLYSVTADTTEVTGLLSVTVTVE